MALVNTRFLPAGLAMLIAAGLAIALKPSPIPIDRRPNLERMIPVKFSDWQIDPLIVPVPPSPDVKARLDEIYDQIISRTYVNGAGQRIMFVVAYGSQQTDTLKAHRMEVCYAAQGFEIKALASAALNLGQSTIPATRMLAVAGSRSEPVTYWFTVGDRVVLSRFERLMLQLRYGLSGEIPDGILVRVSNLSRDASRSFAAHDEFMREMLQAMNRQDAARLVGGT